MTITVDEILKILTEMGSSNFRRMNNPYGYLSDEECSRLSGKEEAFEEVIEAIENLKNSKS